MGCFLRHLKGMEQKNCAGRYNELVRLVYANPSAFYLGGGLPACHRYSNQVASVFAHQLHGVRLERFCPWQCVFFLYLHPLVPDGTEKDRVEIYRLLCGDRGYTAALYLPPPGHRNYFVDLHIVYPGDDTRGTLCLNLYRYNESQRIDCGYVLAKIPRSITITFAMVLRFSLLSVRRFTTFMTR